MTGIGMLTCQHVLQAVASLMEESFHLLHGTLPLSFFHNVPCMLHCRAANHSVITARLQSL